MTMKKETMKKNTAGYIYKGKQITKKTYSMYNVTWWVVDGKTHNTLKEARAYIDNIIEVGK